MAINFPASPSTNDTHTENGITWIFNGTSWDAQGDQVTAASIGLGNVDNTADANKPVSTATQTALDDKQDILAEGAFVDGDKTALDDVAAFRPASIFSGVELDGSSQYGTAEDVTINGNDFIVEAEVYRSSVSDVDQKIITLDRTSGTPVFQIRTGNATGGAGKKLLLQTYFSSYFTAYTQDDVFTDTLTKHIKIIKSGSSVTFYVNGKLMTSGGAAHTTLKESSTKLLYIGRRGGASPNYLDGGVSMLKIYSSTKENDVFYDFKETTNNVVADKSGYHRSLSLSGSPSSFVRNYGAFSLSASASSFSVSADVGSPQACYCDGVNVWMLGNTKIAKYTTAGTLVEGANHSGGLTSWGGAHIYDGRLYAVQFSESLTNKIFSFDPDDLATAPTLEKDLSDIPSNGCNGLHRLADGTWLMGKTNSSVDINKQNLIYQMDSSFNFIRQIEVPIAESYGIQEITETDVGLYINGHSVTGSSTKIWRIRLDDNLCSVEQATNRSQNVGCIAYNPLSGEFIIGNRTGNTCDFHPIAEGAGAGTA